MFKWEFIKSSVLKTIIGADFSHLSKLMIDIRNENLIDRITILSTLCRALHSSICFINTYSVEYKFTDIVGEFLSVILAQSFTTHCDHQAVYYIVSRGPPIFEKLENGHSPEKLAIAKKD